ncbi:AI-2E family transporter [Gloeocapsa sp. PCC 73106]|uniref:AI-2E family transporter n=1 Tax=Gloeocapsa sp. PCC 73106 TaxID=102232 RepID=UPI0002AC791B|nr:AI-2E family transporter [Gloeocapsa sp. PCC 73106]ELR97360.1 putative permease [Gloeocapsa sp. PCC 73106]
MFERQISLSVATLLWVVGIFLSLVLLWQLKSLLVVLMIAVVIASTLAPIINRAEKWGIPRWLGVILAYLGLILLLTGAGLVIGPKLITQIERLWQKLPAYWEILGNLAEALVVRFGVREPETIALINQFFDVQGLTGWAFRSSEVLIVRSVAVTRGVLGVAFNFFLALLLSGYMLAGSRNLIEGLVSLFPEPWEDRLEAQVGPVSDRMGGYIQGRIVVSGILGIVITFGLGIIGIAEFSLALGVIAGFTNLIPFFGPVLGAIPALLVAIAQGGWTFFWVLLLYLVVQNVETYVLDPLLVGSSVRVSPLYQLLAVLGGVQLLGIIGALIVPPWVAGAAVLLENLYLEPKKAKIT